MSHYSNKTLMTCTQERFRLISRYHKFDKWKRIDEVNNNFVKIVKPKYKSQSPVPTGPKSWP